jgi:sugar phosphate isomerase/epimerase
MNATAGQGSRIGTASRIGLSSYAFFWQLSDRVSRPLSIHEALERTAALGVDLFQICDYAPLEAMSEAELRAVRATADSLGISLELGTKGIRTEHLRRFLHIAKILGAPLLRTMFNTPGHIPTADEAVEIFTEVLPEFKAAGVRIAVETYEQVPTSRILEVVERVGSLYLGVCSDPANTVAALESPREVIDAVAPHVLNMHIKDFAFSPQGGVGRVHILRRAARRRPSGLRLHGPEASAQRKKHQPDRRTLAAVAGLRGRNHPPRKPVDPAKPRFPKEQMKCLQNS